MDLDRVIAVRNSKTVYRDGDDCIKVFGDEYGKDEVLSEAFNQSLVEKTGLNVPKIKSVTLFGEKSAIVSEFVKGKTLDRLMTEHPENKLGYIEKLVDIQIEVQAKSCPNLKKLKDKITARIAEADLSEKVKNELLTRLDGMPNHLKLCHGDFNPSNIIVGDDGKDYIIDWSHAAIGNASADAAITYLLFCIAEDFGGADYYLKTFCKKTGTEERYVWQWIPIVAASQSVKGNKFQKEFLLSRLSAID